MDYLKYTSTETLLNSMVDGFALCKMIYDSNGKPIDFIYLKTNGRFDALTGLKDVVGKKVTDVIPQIRESNPEIFEIYGRVAQTQKSEVFETFVAPLNIWLSIRVTSPDKGYFIAVFENITERKLIEDKIKESEEMFSSFFHFVPLMMSITDPTTGRFIDVNDTYSKVTGFSREELIGKSAAQLGIATPEIREHMRKQVEINGSIKSLHLNLKRKDGTFFWCSFTGIIINRSGQKCIMAIAEDITVYKEAETTIKNLNQKMELEIENKTLALTEALREKERYINKSDEYNVTLKNILQEVKIQKNDQILDLHKKYCDSVIPMINKLKKQRDIDHAIIELLEARLTEIFEGNRSNTNLPFYKLTVSESKIVRFIQKGLLAKEIADKLKINLCTVYKHQKHIRKKLGLKDNNIQLRSHIQNVLFSENVVYNA